MNCAEFKEAAAALALDALEPQESEALRRHLEAPGPHEDCHALLAQMQAAASALGRSLTPVPPAPHVWAGIEARLGAPERPRRAAPRWHWREGLAWGLAAAAGLALLLSLTALSGARGRLRETEGAVREVEVAARQAEASDSARRACLTELEGLRGTGQLYQEAVALLEAPGSRVVRLRPQAPGGPAASAVVAPDARRIIVLSSALPAEPGRDYALWVIRGQQAPVPAGFLRSLGNGLAVGEVTPELVAAGTPDAIAVSREPAGGRPTPTEVLLVGSLQG